MEGGNARKIFPVVFSDIKGRRGENWDPAALQGAGGHETYSYPYILASAGATSNDDGAEVVLDDIIIALIIASGVLRVTGSASYGNRAENVWNSPMDSTFVLSSSRMGTY